MLNITEFQSAMRNGMARTSLYRVILPSIPGADIFIPDLQLMCKNAVLPGKQILTSDRQVGTKIEKVVYGTATTDASLSFYLTNNYDAKRYFDAWSQLSVDPVTYEINHKYGPNGYVRDVTIVQLNSKGRDVYICKLKDAFPTTINQIDFSNDGQIAELNVELSYTDWTGFWLPPSADT